MDSASAAGSPGGDGVAPRDILRDKGTPAAELGLIAPEVTDAVLLDAMVAHPVLVNRPIVATPKGVKLYRPSEAVFELLEQRPQSSRRRMARS
jgi:arsenate reductase